MNRWTITEQAEAYNKKKPIKGLKFEESFFLTAQERIIKKN